MDIYQLITLSSVIFVAWLIWQHNNISIIAIAAAKHRCRKEGVQLLDQTVILKKMSLKKRRRVKSARAIIGIERTYHFEFCSVGDHRYQGTIKMRGKYLDHIELEPFKLAQD